MTYESHTVRSLRRDPIPDETVRLVLTVGEDGGEDETSEDMGDNGTAEAEAEDETAETTGDSGATTEDQSPDETASPTPETDAAASVSGVGEAVESLGGEVVRELEFDRLLVEVEQTDLDSVVSLDGVSVVETDGVLGPT